MGELTGGQAVVELLKAEGVRYIFGIVGATSAAPRRRCSPFTATAGF